MTMLKAVFAALAVCFSALACAEVGDTNIIDAIATKPDSPVAALILFQTRPWDRNALDLFAKKVAFYRFSITSGRLVESRDELTGKRMRVVVVYAEQPTDAALAALSNDQAELANDHIELLWSDRQGLISVMARP